MHSLRHIGRVGSNGTVRKFVGGQTCRKVIRVEAKQKMVGGGPEQFEELESKEEKN